MRVRHLLKGDKAVCLTRSFLLKSKNVRQWHYPDLGCLSIQLTRHDCSSSPSLRLVQDSTSMSRECTIWWVTSNGSKHPMHLISLALAPSGILLYIFLLLLILGLPVFNRLILSPSIPQHAARPTECTLHILVGWEQPEGQ